MEYFNKIDSHYLSQLKSAHSRYKLKLEILTANETAIGEITKDVSISAQGQININYQQLVRRSCNLTLINVERRYVPDKNNTFWVNKKFKLWLGVVVQNDIYWFSQGVFYAKSVSGNAHSIQIEGVDKGAALDGSLKLNMLDVKYVIEVGSSITDIVRCTLGLSDNVTVVDTVMPIVDTKFNNILIQKQIEIADGSYLGELFTNIAEAYMSDVYYDVNGRFRITPCLNEINETQYDFTEYDIGLGETNTSCSCDVVNAITVYTNISAKGSDGNDINNVSYTAYNKSPLSPINIKAVGVRRMDSVEVGYVDKLTEEQMTERCKQTANYYLQKESRLKLTTDFKSRIIPHLDVNKAINIQIYGKDSFEKYIVQSITIPLSSEKMDIQAVSANEIPRDVDLEREVG